MVVVWRFCYIFVTKYQQKPILYVGSLSERKNKLKYDLKTNY